MAAASDAADLDALLGEGGGDALAQLARRRPAVGGTDRAQDLERDAFTGQRRDPVDPGRLEDAPLPGRIGGHRLGRSR